MQQIFLVLQILVAMSLITLVLLQQGRGADAGAAFGSGSAGSVFGARGPATLLTRLTGVLAAVFFVNSIWLAYLAREQALDTRSVIEQVADPAGADAPPLQGLGAGDLPLAPADGDEAESDVPVAPAPEQGRQSD